MWRREVKLRRSAAPSAILSIAEIHVVAARVARRRAGSRIDGLEMSTR
jgi:hypothetical protein